MDNRLQKWRELKKKFMDKYNVVISSRARVNKVNLSVIKVGRLYQHQGDNNRDGGRGGGRGGKENGNFIK